METHTDRVPSGSYDSRLSTDISMLMSLTEGVHSWLDVACGDGFFLDKGCADENILRTGIDMSVPLLESAADRVPTGKFIYGNFADPSSVRQSHYDLVTLLGFAYAMQDTEYDISTLIRNMYLWAKPGGTVFMTVIDPDLEKGVTLHGGGDSYEEIGFTDERGDWYTLREPGGSERMNLTIPPVHWVLSIFKAIFKNVKLIDYPEECPTIKGVLATKPGGIYTSDLVSGID